MKHLRARGLALGGSRFVALAGAASVAIGAPSMARAQVAGSYDGYYVSNGHVIPLQRAGTWVGVKVTRNASGALLRGLASEGALDTSRKARRVASRNILLVPVKPSASATQKSALRTRLAGSTAVASQAQAYVFNGGTNTPFIDTGEAVVRFKSGDAALAARAVEAVGGVLVQKISFSPNTFLVRASSNGSGVQLANKLVTRGDVVFSEPNMIVPIIPHATTNDPLYTNEWHLKNTGQGGGTAGADVNIESAWDITRGTQDITVAVLDTGIDTAHEDLAPNMVAGYDFIDKDTDPSPVNAEDNHGTACAGVAAGIGNNGIGVSGAAQNCKVMPIRIIGSGDSGGATALETANAIDFATTNGADVLSNSWGYPQGVPEPAVIRAAIQRSVTSGRGGRGCVITFASGNGDADQIGDSIDGLTSGTAELAADPNVIAVGASNNFDKYISYSNFGESLDVVVPSGFGREGGTLNITTTDRTGDVGYAAGNYTNGFNGTSSACPLVAGVAALLLSSEPNLTAVQVLERLEQTADKVDFAGGTYNSSGHSRLYGYGRINAYSALLGAPAKVTVVTPADGASIKGIVPVTATTTNDSSVQSMTFAQRRLYFSGSNAAVNKAIPDYDTEGVSDSLVVGANQAPRFIQTSANVKVRVEHPYVGDLQIALIYKNTSGSDVREIIYDHANGGDNVLDLDVPLPVALRPIAGTTYTLQVLDDVQQDVGTFVSWGLELGSPYTTIGTQSAANHTSGEAWRVDWNTSGLPTGTYQVRATALTLSGSYSDSNSGLKLAGVSENSFFIAGRVLDDKGVAVAGVTITNLTTKATTRTNASGEFRFSGLASGQYVLAPSITGGFFERTSQTINITTASVSNISFKLTQVDLVAPTLVITTPTNNSFVRSQTQARGTAFDRGGTGVVKVTGEVYRSASFSGSVTGYYTKSGTFASARSDETVLAAIGTERWGLVLPTDAGAYTLTVRAYDKANNVSEQKVTYTIDNIAPTVSILSPKNLSVSKTSAVIASGTATDKGSVAKVTLLLFRPAARTAKGTIAAGYYNPTTKTFTAGRPTAANEILASGTTRWTLRLPALANNRYSLRATATDKAGNSSVANTIFTVSVPSSPSA